MQIKSLLEAMALLVNVHRGVCLHATDMPLERFTNERSPEWLSQSISLFLFTRASTYNSINKVHKCYVISTVLYNMTPLCEYPQKGVLGQTWAALQKLRQPRTTLLLCYWLKHTFNLLWWCKPRQIVHLYVSTLQCSEQYTVASNHTILFRWSWRLPHDEDRVWRQYLYYNISWSFRRD